MGSSNIFPPSHWRYIHCLVLLPTHRTTAPLRRDRPLQFPVPPRSPRRPPRFAQGLGRGSATKPGTKSRKPSLWRAETPPWQLSQHKENTRLGSSIFGKLLNVDRQLPSTSWNPNVKLQFYSFFLVHSTSLLWKIWKEKLRKSSKIPPDPSKERTDRRPIAEELFDLVIWRWALHSKPISDKAVFRGLLCLTIGWNKHGTSCSLKFSTHMQCNVNLGWILFWGVIIY